MLLIGGAFTALLLLLSGLSAAFVPPPTNLTVSCTNLDVSLSWEFSEQQTGTEFKIDVKGSDNKEIHTFWVKERHFDLSHFVWESEARFMAFLGVNVTAVQGGNRSKEAKTSFTFNSLKEAHKKCQLVFPHVDLVETRLGHTLIFKNPLHYYEKLKQATIGSNGASFKFESASSKKDHFDGKCDRPQENCKLAIVFAADVEKCVKLKGELFGSNSIDQVVFRQTAKICAEPEEKDLTVALVVLLFVLGIVIVVIIIIIIKVKAWTMESPCTPPSLLQNHREGEDGPLLIKEDLTHISVVTLFDQPVNPSSVGSEEEEENSRDDNRDDNNRDDNNRDDDNREDNNREGLQPPDAAYSDGGLLEENITSHDDDDLAVSSKEEEEASRDSSTDSSRDSSGYLSREGVQPPDAAYSDGGILEENMKDDDDDLAVSSKEEEEASTDSSRDSSRYLSREGVQPLDAAHSDGGLLEENISDDSAKTQTIETVESIRSHYDRPHAP
ncbi:interferon gamma receptor 1 [Trematomus bernacchii]|uniref:interferon gamma receptor 1 n=1 Tax=Trematomus bernacchii TaxID=40690 RepID=UPI00146C9C2E|nr:interferon gamma receptor 1 [Trematomus bernacchii]